MTNAARTLLSIKILGITLGVIVTALTFLIQSEAAKTADALPISAIKWDVPKPPEESTPAERELFFAKLTQKWIFDNIQEIRNAQNRQSFINTMLSYPATRYLAILGGLCLIIGELWQFYRGPTATTEITVARNTEPSEETLPANDGVVDHQPLIEQADYYRKFHHSLITWYITIQGFVFAGVLASKPAADMVGIICLGLVTLSMVLFIGIIGVFSDRIAILERYISQPNQPTNWRGTHKQEAGFCLKGQGTWFFALICVMFATANLALLLSKDML